MGVKGHGGEGYWGWRVMGENGPRLRGPGETVLGLTGPGVEGYWVLRVGVGVDEESCNEESWGEDSCE